MTQARESQSEQEATERAENRIELAMFSVTSVFSC